MSKSIILSPDPEDETSIGMIAELIGQEFDYLHKLQYDTSKSKYFILYRSQSEIKNYQGHDLSLSTISIAQSDDGVTDFTNRRTLIWPEQDWELFGCEDPRITKIDDTFYDMFELD